MVYCKANTVGKLKEWGKEDEGGVFGRLERGKWNN